MGRPQSQRGGEVNQEVETRPAQESLAAIGVSNDGLYVVTAQGVQYRLVLIDGVLVAKE